MTDIKKVNVVSDSCYVKEKKKLKKKRTVRIILNLPESNEKSCPEFHYGDLLSQHLSGRLGNSCLGDVINGPPREKGDPYASDEDEALKALARSFEKKYGGGVSGGPIRKKRKRENDFKRLGEGYDETDPFIDNSDAIDDVLATNLETKLGGFYINSGALNFEEVQVSEDEKSNDSQIQSVKRKRKNEIVSSEEEEDEENNEDNNADDKDVEDEEVSQVRENGVVHPKKRKLDEGEMLRKRKKMIDKFNASKQKLREDNSENEADNKINNKVEEINENGEDASKKVNSPATSVAASIEAVVSKARETSDHQDIEEAKKTDDKPEEKEKDAAPYIEEKEEEDKGEVEEEEEEEEREGSSSESSSSSASSSSSSSSSSESSSESDSDDEKGGEQIGGKGVENKEEEQIEENEEVCASNDNEANLSDDNERESILPSDLPQDIVAVIDKLKEIGKNNTKASSQKFFTDAVNKMLLSIELKLFRYGGRKKNLIYNHLSEHLPCGTQTLVKRAKNLLVEKLEERLKGPTNKLKEAIDKAMPLLLEAHALECQKLAEYKGEEHESGEETPEGESNKKNKLPRRKFEFTDEIRNLLCDVVKVRCQGWHMVKKRSETPEEHVKNFIESHLKDLWPKGWVSSKILYKESQSAHSFITMKSTKVHSVNPKKLTVLGGGVVSNAVPSTQVPTEPGSINLKPGQNNSNISISCTDKERKENLSQSLISKSSEHLALKSSPPKESDAKLLKIDDAPIYKSGGKHSHEILKESNSNSQVIKSNATNSSESTTPPKDPTKIGNENLSSISPVSESSQRSFHGFESPTKPLDMHKNICHELASRQSLFDSEKKHPKNLLESSSESSPIREGKPPKPSLTATALPKISLANSNPVSKDHLKGFMDRLDASKTKDDKKTITCITIKSVEKINEAVNVKKDDHRVGDYKLKVLEEKTKKRDRNDEKVLNLVSKQKDLKNNFGELRNNLHSEYEKEKILNNVKSDNRLNIESRSKSNLESGNSKNFKLEQEMDHVMNELLQISKKNLEANVDELDDNIGCHKNLGKESYKSYAREKEDLIKSSKSQHQMKIDNIHSYQSNQFSAVGSNSSRSLLVPPSKTSPYSSEASEEKIHHKQFSSEHSSHTLHSSNVLSSSVNLCGKSNSNSKSSHILHQPASDSVTPQNSSIAVHKNVNYLHGKSKVDSCIKSSVSKEVCAEKNLSHEPRAQNVNQQGYSPSSMDSSKSSHKSSIPPETEKLLSRTTEQKISNFSSPSTQSNSNLKISSTQSTPHNSRSSFNGEKSLLNNDKSISAHVPASLLQNESIIKTTLSPNGAPCTSSIQSANNRTSPIQSASHRTSPVQGASHRTSPMQSAGQRTSSNYVDVHKTATPSGQKGQQPPISSQNQNRQISPSNYSDTPRKASSTHSAANHGSSLGSYSGNPQLSSSKHSSSHRSSQLNESHRSSPTNPNSHRSSPQSNSYQSSSTAHSSNRHSSKDRDKESNRSSSSSNNHGAVRTDSLATSSYLPLSSNSNNSSHSSQSRVSNKLQNSHNGSQSGTSSLHSSSVRDHGSALHKEQSSKDSRNYDLSTSVSSSRQIQSHPPAAHNSHHHNVYHSSSRSNSDQKPLNYSHQGVTTQRPSKLSHNIDGLLYHDKSSKASAPIDMTHSGLNQTRVHKNHSQQQQQQVPNHTVSSQKNPSKTINKSGESLDSTLNADIRITKEFSSNLRGSSVAKLKSSDNSSYSSSGSSLPHRSSLSTSSSQSKAKQRSESYSSSASHPLFGNLTQEQEKELLQQMKPGGYLSGLPPGDILKLVSQHSLYQGSNAPGGSSKKPSQF